MKFNIPSIGLLLSVLIMSSCGQNQNALPTPGSPYLGQKPPGLTAERFAPGIVSTEGWEIGSAFSPDMDEFYFIRRRQDNKKVESVIYKKQDNQWFETITPRPVPVPFFSPDGRTIHYGKRYKDRTEDGWSEIKSLGSAYEDISIMRLTTSSEGTYFFDEAGTDGDGVIRYSRLIDGKREAPRPISKEINSGTWNAHPFIASDESYIIWDGKRDGGYGDSDIYISYRATDGKWGPAINLGAEINTSAWEASASVTPDGKYIFFNRNIDSKDYENVDIYWADAQIIEDLRPKNENNTTTASPYFGQKPPGLIPEVFAPGVISLNGRFEGTVSFSPDLDEIYFAASYEGEDTSIYYSRLEGNEWTPIKRANFTKGKKNEEMHPFVSPDGKRIYFTALDASFSDEKIWYVNRLENSWSDAVQLDSPINDDLVFSPNQAQNGDLFYTNISDIPNIKTNYAPKLNGTYPEVQDVEIEFGHHAFISPSQDYLLVAGRSDEGESRKDNDIYAYFKKQDGTWTKPINLGRAINSDLDEKSPRVTTDGEFLFFGRSETDVEPGLSDIYWVSTEVIERLRPETQTR